MTFSYTREILHNACMDILTRNGRRDLELPLPMLLEEAAVELFVYQDGSDYEEGLVRQALCDLRFRGRFNFNLGE